MSNRSLKEIVRKSIDSFKARVIDINLMIESIEINGLMLELMPYEMAKQIDKMENDLSFSHCLDEGECYPHIEEFL